MYHCPACNSPDFKFLGTLGDRDHLRCFDCGIDYSAETEEPEWEESDSEEWEESAEIEPDCDDSDDGQALASAGFGTDEDYGGGYNEDF